MKLNKKTIVVFVAGTIGLGAIMAPILADGDRNCTGRHHGKHFTMMGEHGMGKYPDEMISKMAHKLDMTKEQRDQAFAKFDEYRPKIRETSFAIHDNIKNLHEMDSSTSGFVDRSNKLADQQGDLIAEMIKLRTSVHIEIEQLLTDEQKTKLGKMKQWRGHHRGHHGSHESEQSDS